MAWGAELAGRPRSSAPRPLLSTTRPGFSLCVCSGQSLGRERGSGGPGGAAWQVPHLVGAAGFGSSNRRAEVSRGFTLSFLMTRDVQHLSMCLCAICRSSVVRFLLRV